MQSPESFRKIAKVEEKAVKTETVSKENKKIISKILISEVHFCRFLFKLIQKMKDSSNSGILKSVNEHEVSNIFKNYAGIIRHKIENLLNFKSYNYIKCEGYREYKQTSDFEKLMKISSEYNERYKMEIN